MESHRYFRSYDTRPTAQSEGVSYIQDVQGQYSGRPGDVCVWQVARATTAAPLYFKPFKLAIDGGMLRVPTGRSTRRATTMTVDHSQFAKLEDGGFGPANNPSWEMLEELRKQLPSKAEVGTFVSVGTARPKEKSTGSRLYRLIRHSIARLGDPEKTHERMETMETRIPTLSYYRLNQAVEGPHGVEMDDWKPSVARAKIIGMITKKRRATGEMTVRKMKDAFYELASDIEMIEYMQKCAEELVAARRARIDANYAKWNRFTLGRYFVCRANCDDEFRREIDEDTFRAHLRVGHNIVNEEEIEAALRRSEEHWTYRGP